MSDEEMAYEYAKYDDNGRVSVNDDKFKGFLAGLKAEQFLDGESTTSNECHDCAKFDEMPKGPRCKTCDNGSHFQRKE
jgi:hypothetical protein